MKLFSQGQQKIGPSETETLYSENIIILILGFIDTINQRALCIVCLFSMLPLDKYVEEYIKHMYCKDIMISH